MSIVIPLDRVEDRLRGGELWNAGWGTPEDPEAMTCLHGAIRYCQLVPGDAYLIEQVGARFGFGTGDNDEAESWEEFRPRVPAVVTDDMLADTFGPQWPQIVALVRRAATLTPEECQQLSAAWVFAWESAVAAFDAARDTVVAAARAAQWAAVGEAAWAAAWDDEWEYAGESAGAARDTARALAVRHLIGSYGFTQAHYDTLTGPWRTVIGPAHPDDK